MKNSAAASTVVLVLAAAMAAAGCGSSGYKVPVHGSTAANQEVCRHYLQQHAWLKKLTKPSVADALAFETEMAADIAASSGTLHTDLARLQEALAKPPGPGTSAAVLADSEAVYNYCA